MTKPQLQLVGITRAPGIKRSFRTVAISLYDEDVRHIDELVHQLKLRGVTWANRSLVYRALARTTTVDEIAALIGTPR